MDMIAIDGSHGEGGGQILRSSLSLSLLTGKGVSIRNIRAGRPKPGLMRQHLACVEAAGCIGGAEISGAETGSGELEFRPGEIRGGEYRFAVGSAGSTMLVFQTVLLPLLLGAKEPSHLVLEGGTHNPFAPPYDFIARAFLPLLQRMGAKAAVSLKMHGFYPAGGGRVEAWITPVPRLKPLKLTERGAPVLVRAEALGHGIPSGVLHDETRKIVQLLELPPEAQAIREVDSPGPGNAAFVEFRYENLTEIFTAFGEKGVPRRKVAALVAAEAREYLESGAPVGPCLADQLLLPLALAGKGKFVTGALTPHSETNLEVIRKFLPVEIAVRPLAGKLYEVEAKS